MTASGGGNVLAARRRALEREAPLNAHLELTRRCTCRCSFCYNAPRLEAAPLSAPEWTDVLDSLRELGTLVVTFTGGEPLCHGAFFEIARAARHRFFAVRILTNGTLVDEAAADAIADMSPLSVELSLHGASAASHDAATRTDGSFDRLLVAVDLLRRRSVRLVLKTPLTCRNEAEVEDIIALAATLALPLNVDPRLTPRDDGDPAPLAFAASDGAVRACLERARGGEPRPPQEGACGAGRSRVAVDPEGNVFPCLQWRTAPLGNVREGSLVEIWRSSPARAGAIKAVASAEAAPAPLWSCPATTSLSGSVCSLLNDVS